MESVDAILIKFAWGDQDPAVALREALGEASELRLFRAIDLDEGYAYVSLENRGQARIFRARFRKSNLASTIRAWPRFLRLTQLANLPGASAGRDAPYRYVVETDVAPEHEADFNAWYQQEHLAGLAAVPGTVRAARYRNIDGHPRYHACYDLEHPETLQSAPWLAVRATPWSDRVRPTFRNTKRTLFRSVNAIGIAID